MNVPRVNSFDFYYDVAYNASQRVVLSVKGLDYETRKRLYERESAKRFYKSLYNQLTSIISHFPKIEELTKFYVELVDTVIGIDAYKKSLGAVNWARFMVKKLYFSFRKKELTLKQLYGRSKSVLKQVRKDFTFLDQTGKKMLKFPSVKKLPTVLLAGFPNVGKTSLLAELTTSRPEINSYPFTTKNINVGVMKAGNYKVQIVDTPGLLERPFEKRNVIEKKAIVALKHLADIILFVFDSSKTSGFSLKEQEKLFNEISNVFPKSKIYTVTNKCELDKSKKTKFYTSCKTGEGIKELKEFIIKKLV
jgi:nucleolar GTP-binding protein